LGTSSIEYKPFGTQIDFLPIVLGNGNIRLEVRPRVSDLDFSIPVDLNGIVLPALDVRQVDTAVEMKAGQTFAIAGLIQEKSKSRNRGLPFLTNMPIIGIPFRGTENEVEEIELLVLVTPEFVDPIDAYSACAGPGYATTNPTTHQLFCAGHVEVPAHCNPIAGPLACGECGGPCGANSGCATCRANAFSNGHIHVQGGMGYDQVPPPAMNGQTITDGVPSGAQPMQMEPGTQMLPPQRQQQLPPQMPVDLPLPNEGASARRTFPQIANRGVVPQNPVTRPYVPPREPVYMRNAPVPNNPQGGRGASQSTPGQSGLIGPVGYDIQ
jgi:hypothetical protein